MNDYSRVPILNVVARARVWVWIRFEVNSIDKGKSENRYEKQYKKPNI
jgi:hypothetical protein